MSSHRAEHARAQHRSTTALSPTRRHHTPPEHAAGRSRPRAKLLAIACGVVALSFTGGGAFLAASPVAHAQPLSARHLGTTAALPRVNLAPAAPGDAHRYRDADRPSRDGTRRPIGAAASHEGAAQSDAGATSRRAELREVALSGVAVRARVYARQVARQTWALPTSHFHISTWFGEAGWYWSSGYHTGIDFVSSCGAPEVAVSEGTVVQAGWDGPYGYQVRLRLPGGDQVWYNHLTTIKTHLGAELRKGGLIGLMGETGNAFGCHLHFEYRVRGALKEPVDPAPYFAAHGINLHALQAAYDRTAQ